MRYLVGCRCRRCRNANRLYEQKLNRDRKLYGPNDLVSVDRVLAHLAYLKTFGMGHKTVAKHAKVAKTALAEIIWYDKKHIRRRSEARILAIEPTLDKLPRNVNVPAAETLQRIGRLVRWGYPKGLISVDALDNDSRALQVNKTRSKFTTVRTAVQIRDFYELILRMRDTWQQTRRIPRRQYVYWKRHKKGRRPYKPSIGWLELRPFAASYNVNYLWPKELREISRLTRSLERQIREKGKEHAEQHGHAAQRIV